MTIVCECGAKLRMDPLGAAAYFNGGMRLFWQRHGHAPGKVSYLCECGERHDSGPLRHPDGPKVMMATDLIWYSKHQVCIVRGSRN